MSIRDYVTVRKDKDIQQLVNASETWLKAEQTNKLSYEIDWLGIPIIQLPEDMIMMQELIWKTKPDYIIECGVAHGGGLIFYASLLELMGNGKAIGIDIDIREHNEKAIKSHPLSHRIELIQCDSSNIDIDFESDKMIVCLDSNHEKNHVLKELDIFKNKVGIGYYIVVFDTSITKAVQWGYV